MPHSTGPDLTGRDLLILILGLLLGILWAEAAEPLLLFVFTGDGWMGDYLAGMGSIFKLDHSTRVALHLVAIALAPLTLGVPLLPLLRPRGERRACYRLPGVVACLALSLVLILEAAYYPITQYGTLYGELTRAHASAVNNIVQYPRADIARTNPAGWLLGAVGFNLGPHAGLAAIGVLLTRRLTGLPTSAGGSLNRLALCFAVIWVAIALSFAVIPELG